MRMKERRIQKTGCWNAPLQREEKGRKPLRSMKRQSVGCKRGEPRNRGHCRTPTSYELRKDSFYGTKVKDAVG